SVTPLARMLTTGWVAKTVACTEPLGWVATNSVFCAGGGGGGGAGDEPPPPPPQAEREASTPNKAPTVSTRIAAPSMPGVDHNCGRALGQCVAVWGRDSGHTNGDIPRFQETGTEPLPASRA